MNTEALVEVQPFKKEIVLELSRNLLWQAILVLIPHRDFSLSIDWLSSKLAWASLEEVDRAIKSLRNSGILQLDNDGRFREVDIDLNAYLTVEEQIENDFLFSTQVSTMVCVDHLSTKYTRMELVAESAYRELADGIGKLLKEFNEKALKTNPAERKILAAIAVNMTNILREHSNQPGGQA